MVIGLTGGIASGKSAAAHFFAELGINVIDTDDVARQVVAPSQPAYSKIIEHFGSDILDEDQQLDRQQLRQIIFNNTDEKQWLEHLLHPLIREISANKIASSQSSYCILVIPLLFETWPNPLVDRVLVIDCLSSTQLKRLTERDAIDKTLAKKILQQQASRQQRLSIADDTIENNNSMIELRQAILTLHEYYTRSE